MIDIEDVMLQRIDQLEEDDPELDTDYQLVAEDNRGVITISSDEVTIGAEFVESDLSWGRGDALEEYNEAADEGLYVAIIVPNDAFFHMIDRVNKQGRENIVVYSYESLGILSTPMAG